MDELDDLTAKFNRLIGPPITFTDKNGNTQILIIDGSRLLVLSPTNNSPKLKIIFKNGFTAAPFLHCFDKKENKLYVFDENLKGAIVNVHPHIYDKDIKYVNNEELRNTNFNTCEFVRNRNELHLINKCNHFTINITNDDIINVRQNLNMCNFGEVGRLIYNEKSDKLFVLGAGEHFDDILWYRKSFNTWNSCKAKMPYQMSMEYYIVLQIDKLLLLVYLHETTNNLPQMYVFDTENAKLYKQKELQIPSRNRPLSLNTYGTIDANKNIHIIDYKNGYHYKQNIINLLPTDIIEQFKIKNELLSFGYVHKYEHELDLYQNFATYLNYIVMSYLPVI